MSWTASLRRMFNIAALSGLTALNAAAQTPADSTWQLQFSTLDIKVHSIFPPWTDFAVRQAEYLTNDSIAQAYDAWLTKTDVVRGKPLAEQAIYVDKLVNAYVRWIDDRDNYKQDDYWAPAAQTILTGRGDCDDFSTAKYDVLRRLGVDSSRLAVLTTSGPNGAAHAVLAVDTSATRNWTNPLILDNAILRTHYALDHTGYTVRRAITPGLVQKCTMRKVPKNTL